MDLSIRSYKSSDLSFLHEMLYEAIYWRENPNKPSFAEAKIMPDFIKILENFEHRNGDLGVTALTKNCDPVGAAWIRCWKESDNMRGYMDSNIPILVIAVKEKYRNKKVGYKLIKSLLNSAKQNNIKKISLCVSKDNYAIDLYRQCGFIEYSDIDCSYIMFRNI